MRKGWCKHVSLVVVLVLTKVRSVCTIMHTLPWLGVYLGKIPSAAGAMVAFQENARRLAKERLERGSETRDLYHYLVSSSFERTGRTTSQTYPDV